MNRNPHIQKSILCSPQLVRLFLCGSVAPLASACKDEHAPIDQSDTDGIITGFADDGPTGGGGGADGADETGEPLRCFTQEKDGIEATKFECKASLKIDITARVHPEIGPDYDINPRTGDIAFDTLEEGSYEKPIAMGCCDDVPEWPEETCELPHFKACYNDVIAFVCNSVGKMVEAEASDHLPFNGKLAIEDAGSELLDHRQDCYEHFWKGGDETCDAGDFCALDSCDIDNGPLDNFLTSFPTWKPGVVGKSGLSKVVDIEVTVQTMLPHDAVQPPPHPASSCEAPDENDGVPAPSTAAGTSGSFVRPVADIPVSVTGPLWGGEAIRATGAFSESSSTLHRSVDAGNLVVDEWAMVEAAPTTAGTSAVRASVDDFHLQLAHAEVAMAVGGGWELAEGTAAFHLGATVDSYASGVVATNSTKVRLTQLAPGVGACPTSGGPASPSIPSCSSMRTRGASAGRCKCRTVSGPNDTPAPGSSRRPLRRARPPRRRVQRRDLPPSHRLGG